MLLSKAIRGYGDYCRHELAHTTSTYYSYVSWQRNFAKWLEGQDLHDPDIREITSGIIQRFSYSLSARDLRPRTVRGRSTQLAPSLPSSTSTARSRRTPRST